MMENYSNDDITEINPNREIPSVLGADAVPIPSIYGDAKAVDGNETLTTSDITASEESAQSHEAKKTASDETDTAINPESLKRKEALSEDSSAFEEDKDIDSEHSKADNSDEASPMLDAEKEIALILGTDEDAEDEECKERSAESVKEEEISKGELSSDTSEEHSNDIGDSCDGQRDFTEEKPSQQSRDGETEIKASTDYTEKSAYKSVDDKAPPEEETQETLIISPMSEVETIDDGRTVMSEKAFDKEASTKTHAEREERDESASLEPQVENPDTAEGSDAITEIFRDTEPAVYTTEIIVLSENTEIETEDDLPATDNGDTEIRDEYFLENPHDYGTGQLSYISRKDDEDTTVIDISQSEDYGYEIQTKDSYATLLPPETDKAYLEASGAEMPILTPTPFAEIAHDAEDEILAVNNGVDNGAVINGFTVIEKLSVIAGEADLYLCEKDGKKYVLKLYKRVNAVKKEVSDIIAKISSPYIASPIAQGRLGEFPYEIIPYYKNGSLKGRKYTLEELYDFVIPGINEALRVLHENRIIHKDVKSANTMLCDDERSFALIDFGISTVIKDNENKVVVDNTGLTRIYSAPEVKFTDIAYVGSDYYSFGIMIYELFVGELPLSGMSDKDRDRYLQANGLPIPDFVPDELCSLILGLTYADISNRSDAENPNKRWTYNEVARWCRGQEVPVPGRVREEDSVKVSARENDTTATYTQDSTLRYTFDGTEYKTVKELVTAFSFNWEKARDELYSDELSELLKGISEEMYRLLCDAKNKSTDKDAALWRFIYTSNCLDGEFVWLGERYPSAEKFGKSMLDAMLSNGDISALEAFVEKRILSSLFALSDKDGAKEKKSTAASVESLFDKDKSEYSREKCLFTAAYLLIGECAISINGKEFQNLTELQALSQSLYDKGVAELRDFAKSMTIGNPPRLMPRIAAWIEAGK